MIKNLYITLALTLLMFSSYGQQQQTFKLPSNLSAKDYEEGTIVVKIRASQTKTSTSSSQKSIATEKSIQGLALIGDELKKLGVTSSKNPFPNEDKKMMRSTKPQVDLSDIYFIKIGEGQSLEQAINDLRQNENVEYAEPYYRHQLLLIPNDPNANPTGGTQYQLKTVKAYEAWDEQRGDTNVVIGIVDTGVLLDHLDLKDNIKYNYADPINNIDDDNDGYVDNYYGWDFSDRDNNPSADSNGHGTEVAGCSNGQANNGIGIAGTSFNSKFLPLKVFRSSDNRFSQGFEAIKYAADKGCKVINISWGSEGSFSRFEQNIIDYAVLEKDVVIVAAAGNTPSEIKFYPASYDHVLSVGATNALDQKASFSTYNTKIDICAPGDLIGTTGNGGVTSYLRASGTSFSSPIVAGAAALVRSKFPKLNALQVMEQLRVTADDIFSDEANAVYKEKLGKGRLNMFRALTDTTSPSVRLVSQTIDNGGRNVVFYDDTVKILCEFKNYLATTNNAKVTLTSSSPYVTLLKSEFDLGKLGKLESINNFNTPFEVYIAPNTPHSQRIIFRLGFEDGDYHDYQYFEIYTSPDYLDVTFNSITVNTRSKGSLSFTNVLENGMGWLGSTGIMFATSSTNVSNNVVSNLSTGQTDQNLTATRDIKYIKASQADTETRGTLVDTLNNTNKIGLIVTQKQYGWKNSPDNCVILEYYVTNFSGAPIPTLFTGLFADWNVGAYNKNRAEWDATNGFGYVYSSTPGNTMVGVALLTEGTPIYYALDNAADNGNGIILNDGFTRQEKYFSLSNGLGKLNAGMDADGSDVSHVIGARIDNINNKKSFKMAYAVVIGNSLEELQARVAEARSKFNETQIHPVVSLNINYCSNSSAHIKRADNKPFKLYNALSSTAVYSGTEYVTTPLTQDTSYYITVEDEGFESELSRVLVTKRDIVADFQMDKDTLDLLNGNKVLFTDYSTGAIQWNWDFNNGYNSSNRSTYRIFNKQGVYPVTLSVQNSTGCTSTITKNLVVISTSPKPVVSSISVCKGGSTEIKPQGGSNFNFYSSYPLTSPVFSGRSLNVNDINSSTSYWVTNIDSLFESEALEVKINVLEKFASFNFSTDTLNLDVSNTVEVSDLTMNSTSWLWNNGIDSYSGSNHAEFTFNKVGKYEIKLIVQSAGGCVDSVSKNLLVVRKSPAPENQEYNVCANGSVKIEFPLGTRFRFYSKYPDTLLGEGNFWEINSLSTDQLVYVTNLDSLIESDPAVVSLKIIKSTVDFSMSADTLNLNDADSVAFTSNSENVASLLWDFGNGATSSEISPYTFFDTEGDYTITLTGTNANGCSSSVTKNLTVIKPESDLEKNVSVYPNPANDFISVKSIFPEDALVEVRLLNNRGEEVQLMNNKQLKNQVVTFDVSNYPLGLYFVKIKSGSKTMTAKVLLNH